MIEEGISCIISVAEFYSSINSISEHRYQDTSYYSLDSVDLPEIVVFLTNKRNVRGNLASYSISANAVKESGIDFYLGETNSFIEHDQLDVSNTSAATLWTIDYNLHAACIGVSGIQFHQGVGYKYSGKPSLRSLFLSHIIFMKSL